MADGKKSLKLNNAGATLVLVVATIAFVTLLIVTVLSASATNLALKRAQIKSEKAFYTAETAIDEIYSAVGVKALNQMNVAFSKTSSNLLETAPGTTIQVMKTNAQANAEMRKNFVHGMYEEIAGTGNHWPATGEEVNDAVLGVQKEDVLAKAKVYLEDCIRNVSDTTVGQDTKSIKVENIEGINAKVDEINKQYYVELKGVRINYLAGNDYFSKITTDIQIEYPNMDISFVEEGKLTDFLYYTLISDGDLAFENGSANQITVASSIYSGRNINMSSKSKVYLDGSATSGCDTGSKTPANEAGDGVHINVVSREDFKIDGVNASDLTLSTVTSLKAVDLWSRNLALANNYNVILEGSDADNNYYLEDDLQIDSANSTANIGGNYYGYKNEKEIGGTAAQSSSIIMNGASTKLNISVSDLMLGGRSYIKLSDSVSYAMGEGISSRGNQDTYLILDKYIGFSADLKEPASGVSLSNPMSTDTWNQIKTENGKSLTSSDETIAADDIEIATKLTESILSAGSDFYAKNLLNQTQPVTVKKVAHNRGFEVFLYYNFKDSASESAYISDLLNDASPNRGNADYEAERNILIQNLKAVVDSISVSADAGKLYSNATLIKGADSTSISGFSTSKSRSVKDADALQAIGYTTDQISALWDADSTYKQEDFAKKQVDLNIRRYIISSHLVTIPKSITFTQYATAESVIKAAKSGAYVPVSSEADVLAGPTASMSSALLTDSTIPSANSGADNAFVSQYLASSAKNYKLVVTDQNVTITEDGIEISGMTDTAKRTILKNTNKPSPNCGIIICYGGSSQVRVDADFVGLIICQGKIIVRDGVTVYTRQADVLEAIENSNSGFREYFSAFRSVTGGDKDSVTIGKLEYSDLVSLVNWKK